MWTHVCVYLYICILKSDKAHIYKSSCSHNWYADLGSGSDRCLEIIPPCGIFCTSAHQSIMPAKPV